MKVILTQDVKSQGKKGDLINVSDGYANNFLLKKGLAKIATKQAINELESKKGAEQYRKNQEELKAQNIADRMKDFTVKLTAKAGKEGKLFGSITSKDVAQALKDQYNITVDKRKIDLPDGKKSGLKEAVRILKGIEDIAVFRFTEKDVVRHRLVQDIIRAYERASRTK